MVGILIENKYKYTKAVLPISGVEVTGYVYIRDGKIYKTDNISCKKDIDEVQNNFSFTLSQPEYYSIAEQEKVDEWKAPKLNTSGWPSGVSVNDTIEEFKQFVLKDIA